MGMWAYKLTVEDYQDLIDRGWRRSGQYCYKPIQKVTCCPLYTIRCEALNFKLSKSQKKLLNKVGKFLFEGDILKHNILEDVSSSAGKMEPASCEIFDERINKIMEQKSNQEFGDIMEVDVSMNSDDVLNKSGEKYGTVVKEENKLEEPTQIVSKAISENQQLLEASEKRSSSIPKPGVGRDISKPQCKKAKLLRLEKKQKKILEKGSCVGTISRKEQPSEKSLEDLIHEFTTENAVNKLEMCLLPSNSKEELIKESWHLFRKYQMVIHNETEDECSYSTFHSFLVATPLKPQLNVKGKPYILGGYGSFHQQYRLNGQLIAVGVIDILPKCVSSVYFFYDPDYSFLSLGTYGSLREIELTRFLHQQSPEMCYYYMGYYIHTCPKMRYKARYIPSSLLCPEVYTWHPIESCQDKLNGAKYSRFNDDPEAACEDSVISISEVLILHDHVIMPYAAYKLRRMGVTEDDEEEVRQYAGLVGRKCAERMLLYR